MSLSDNDFPNRDEFMDFCGQLFDQWVKAQSPGASALMGSGGPDGVPHIAVSVTNDPGVIASVLDRAVEAFVDDKTRVIAGTVRKIRPHEDN